MWVRFFSPFAADWRWIAHFIGISTSAGNDTHRTCNAQQLRMDFVSALTEWSDANQAHQIRNSWHTSKQFNCQYVDERQLDGRKIHLFVCVSPNILVYAWPRPCDCNASEDGDDDDVSSRQEIAALYSIPFVFTHTKQLRTDDRPYKKQWRKWANHARHTTRTMMPSFILFYFARKAKGKTFRLILDPLYGQQLNIGRARVIYLARTHTHTLIYTNRMHIALFQHDISSSVGVFYSIYARGLHELVIWSSSETI